MERGTWLMVAAVLAGISAGAAAAITATAFPYAMGAALNSMRYRRKKEQREQRHKLKEKVKKTASMNGPREGQSYKEAILRGLVRWRDIDASLADFPYHLSEATKMGLLDSAFIHLKRPEYARFTAELASVSPCILLTGPPGSEIYQETLVKALARHLEVNLLIFDSTQASLEANDSMPPGTLSMQEVCSVPAGGEAAKSYPDSGAPADPEPAERDHLGYADRTPVVSLGPGSSVPVSGSSISLQNSAHSLERDVQAPGGMPGATLVTRLPSSRRSKDPSYSTHPSASGPCTDANVPSTSSSSSASRSKACPETALSEFCTAAGSLPAAAMDAKSLMALAGLDSSKKTLHKGDRVRYVGSGLPATMSGLAHPAIRGPPVGLKGRVLMVLEDNPHKVGVRFDKPIYGGNNLVDLCEDGHGFFCSVGELRAEAAGGEDSDKLLVEALLEVISSETAQEPLIVLIRNSERAVAGNLERYMKLERLVRAGGPGLSKSSLPGLVVIGSHTAEARKEKASTGAASGRVGNNITALLDMSILDQLTARMDEAKGEGPRSLRTLSKLFPTRITVHPPQDDVALREWNAQLERDAEILKAESNRQRLRMVLNRASVECESLPDVTISDQVLTQEVAEKIVGWGASHQLQQNPETPLVNGKLAISLQSVQHSLSTVQAGQQRSPAGSRTSLKDVVCDNEFEKMLVAEVVPPDELRVTFDHIGALDNVKETLKELVMLPLQRPELFRKGQLTKPVRGLLLFGPPGTGKTMLAKAVATEAGANFINVSMATIASKWFGEAEKYIKAVFTLASKIAPSVIFIDEVDSMLGRRGKDNEHSAMRKVKNELMSSWDGLRTQDNERVLLLAATNRPFDLDEAVIRRFPRRLMVDLPSTENRAKILRVILAEEEVEQGFDIAELAAATDGYSGSDLRNLCTTAAYRRIREILDKEKKDQEKAKMEGREATAGGSSEAPELRALSMEDMKQAMEKVRSSVAADASSMIELTQWNEQYGEGGHGKKAPLSYFM